MISGGQRVITQFTYNAVNRECINYSDVIMGTIASQITSLTIVYSTVYSGADQRKHQSSASLGFVRWIHRGSVNSPHKWPVTLKMFPFDDVIMILEWTSSMSFLAATKQLQEHFFLSVRLSVRHTFLTMFPSCYHHEIFRSYYQWQKWRPCKRSRSEVKGQGHRGQHPT